MTTYECYETCPKKDNKNGAGLRSCVRVNSLTLKVKENSVMWSPSKHTVQAIFATIMFFFKEVSQEKTISSQGPFSFEDHLELSIT